MSNARFATVLAVAATIFGAGIVSGAAGDALIIGAANSGGTSNTSLNTNSTGFAWQMNQTGSGVGVFAISSNGNALAALAHNGDKYGLSVTNDGVAGTGSAIIADGRANVGIRVSSDSATGMIVESGTCTGIFCGRNGITSTGYGFGSGVSGVGGVAGVTGTGAIGVIGDSNTDGNGLFTSDNAQIDGDLTVGGTCTGCTAALLGINSSDEALAAGTAVTAIGATTDAAGRVVLQVRAAAAGETVIGIVESALQAEQQDLSADSAMTSYKATGAAAGAGAYVRIVTSGIATFAAAGVTSGAVAAGDALAVGSAPGQLAVTGDAAAAVGRVLGTLADGRLVVFVGAR